LLILETLHQWRFTPVTIYPPTYIHETVIIGKDTKIGAFGNIDKNVVIGENCNIQAHAKIHTGTRIGDNVFLGPDVTLLNDLYPMSKRLAPPEVKKHAILCGCCVINPGVIIGENAVVVSHSLVTKNIPTMEVWLGSPARYYCSTEEYLEKKQRYESDMN